MSNYNRFEIKLQDKPKTGAKPKKAIPKMSAKRKKEVKVYRKIVKEKIEANDECQLKLPGCFGKAQGGDHIQKRSPKNYADPDNIIPACNSCNLLKELKPVLAAGKGLTKSRFKK